MAKEKHLLDTNNNLHRDPITGEPGSHPVGTGVGATGGADAGAHRVRAGLAGDRVAVQVVVRVEQMLFLGHV